MLLTLTSEPIMNILLFSERDLSNIILKPSYLISKKNEGDK